MKRMGRGALALVLVFVLISLFSCMGVAAGHCCIAPHCRICLFIDQVLVLMSVICTAVGSRIAAAARMKGDALHEKQEPGQTRTLISLKTELLN